MLVRGRRLDPRRILRYLFQELLAPWIQLKRLWLRVVWFFTTPIHIGPMWTSSVVCGLLGVMLTILLFKSPGKLQASTNPIAVVSPPIPLLAPPPTTPFPLFTPLAFDVSLDGRLIRMTLGPYWDQVAQTTLVSTSPDLIHHNIVQPIRDGWTMAQRQASEALPSIYRQTAALWDPSRVPPAVTPSDRPASYGGAGESHPAIVVTRDIPAEVSPSQPVTYSLIVQNRGAELLEQILVTEQPANLDRIQETFPPAEVSATALHWRIDELRPGQERRLAITLAPGTDREIQALAEVRTTVAVSSSTKVAAAAPLTANEAPQILHETPKLSPVQPASQEEVPRTPRLSVVAEIANLLKVDDELSTVFVVSNTGNGDADGVVLTVEIPAELEHRDGVLVEHRYALIPAGTTKRAIFKAVARTPGSARVNAALTMGGARVADWTTQIQIAARPIVTPTTKPSTIASPLSGGTGPAPEDGSRRPSTPFPTTTRPSNPGSTIPFGAPSSGGVPSMQSPTPSVPPVNSSIPRNRLPVASPPAGGPPAAPGGLVPGSSIPGSAPAATPTEPGSNPPSPKDDAADGTNFVSVPRRQDPGAVMGWKRVMGR